MITLDLSKAKLSEDLESYKDKVKEIHDMIHNKTGAGNDFLGWVELPENYDKAEVELIKETAASLRKKNRCVTSLWYWGILLRCTCSN